MKTITVKTRTGTYPIFIETGALSRAGELFDLDRRVLIVTDENIPYAFVECVRRQCRESAVFCIAPGEGSKTLASFEAGLKVMFDAGFCRTDCVAALGGGVVGDLAGFIAASFLRGVDCYNIPTTTLSQVDSSIGGKVAVNFEGCKNMVGAFYPPKGVLIDPDTLKTLPPLHVAAGLAEAVKMALCFDADLFCFLEEHDPMEHFEEVMEKSLRIKKAVVEQDETEQGLRRVLNFGHTVGHAIESRCQADGTPLPHGACVALGMIPMTDPAIRPRLRNVLAKLGLLTVWEKDPADLTRHIRHDKKIAGDRLTTIEVSEIGNYHIKTVPIDEFTIDQKGWTV